MQDAAAPVAVHPRRRRPRLLHDADRRIGPRCGSGRARRRAHQSRVLLLRHAGGTRVPAAVPAGRPPDGARRRGTCRHGPAGEFFAGQPARPRRPAGRMRHRCGLRAPPPGPARALRAPARLAAATGDGRACAQRQAGKLRADARHGARRRPQRAVFAAARLRAAASARRCLARRSRRSDRADGDLRVAQGDPRRGRHASVGRVRGGRAAHGCIRRPAGPGVRQPVRGAVRAPVRGVAPRRRAAGVLHAARERGSGAPAEWRHRSRNAAAARRACRPRARACAADVPRPPAFQPVGAASPAASASQR